MFQISCFVKNRGVSAFVALAVMTTLLLMVFGLVSIISPQIKMIGEIGKSVVAFHAADSGIERLAEAIFVGYDYYDYPANGECVEVGIGEEEMKYICDYTNCIPLITFNDWGNCGLPSKCNIDADCICPKDKCIGYNFYEYSTYGSCDAICNWEHCCTGCIPSITANSSLCGYNPEKMESCDPEMKGMDYCSCPASGCIGSLELGAVIDIYPSGWKTPYSYLLPNMANCETYVRSSKSIESIGTYEGASRAIETSF